MKHTATSRAAWTRRDFLRASAAMGSLTVIPHGRAQDAPAPTDPLPPSERVNLAVVGIGNMGNGDRATMLQSGHCQVVALCDVDERGRHTLAAREAHPSVRLFTDFRRMFDAMAADIDAVLIAIPDHAHFPVAMQAMALGKHVYVEKPLAHTFGQCARLIAMAERSGVVTQMGNQGHSGANYFQFKAWTEAGVIGNISRITAYMNSARRWHGWGRTVAEYPSEPLPEGLEWDTWIGPSPVHPYSRRLHPQEWRSWFDYGSGAFGDWGPHILDTAHRFLELGLPTEIEAVARDGANPLVYPQSSTIRFHFPVRGSRPSCDVTWYDGVDNRPRLEEELLAPAPDGAADPAARRPAHYPDAGKVLYGDGIVFHGGSHATPLRIVPEERHLEMREHLPRVSGRHSDHHTNFLLACKGEETARSPFAVSGVLTQVFNLGIIAQRLGGKLAFDPERSVFPGNPEAQALLDPAPRRGWESFYAL